MIDLHHRSRSIVHIPRIARLQYGDRNLLGLWWHQQTSRNIEDTQSTLLNVLFVCPLDRICIFTVFCLSLWLGVIPVFVSSRHQIAVVRSPGHPITIVQWPGTNVTRLSSPLQGWEFWTKRTLMSDKDLCLMQLVSVQAELCQVISVHSPQTQTPPALQ